MPAVGGRAACLQRGWAQRVNVQHAMRRRGSLPPSQSHPLTEPTRDSAQVGAVSRDRCEMWWICMCVSACPALRPCGTAAWVGAGEENGRAMLEPRTPQCAKPARGLLAHCARTLLSLGTPRAVLPSLPPCLLRMHMRRLLLVPTRPPRCRRRRRRRTRRARAGRSPPLPSSARGAPRGIPPRRH